MRRVVASCVCIAVTMSASAAELGRLFFTPNERAQLDVARTQKKAPPPPAGADPAEAPVPEIVSYGGIVRRSDGKALVWINDKVVDEKEALGALSLKGSVSRDGAVTFQVPQSGAHVQVKVGQSIDLQSGRVAEGRNPPIEPKPPATDKKVEASKAEAAPAPPAKGASGESPEKRAQAGREAELERRPESERRRETERRVEPERKLEDSAPAEKPRLTGTNAATK